MRSDRSISRVAGAAAAANHAAAGEQALPHSHSERRVGGWMGRGLLPCAQNGGEGGKEGGDGEN